jgi:hypothetical protein
MRAFGARVFNPSKETEMAKYQANRVAGERSAFMQAFGNCVIHDDKVTPSAALALNDTVDLIRIAGGTRLVDLEKFNGDFDTATTLQYKLGYRAADAGGVLETDDDYFGSALTDLQAAVTSGSRTRYTFDPITFNEDVIIFATVTAAATGVSGTPSITTIARGKAVGIK